MGGCRAVPAVHGVGLLALSVLLAGAGAFLTRRRDAAMTPSRRLATRNFLRFGLLLLLVLVPPVAYAASVALPHTFVNGTLPDADEMNANFTAVARGFSGIGRASGCSETAGSLLLHPIGNHNKNSPDRQA